ncbi:hypothetical protein Goari_024936, partial [Gossypium aridum]|nr:hypothetical protein [Gossypium aridum]
MRKFFKNLAMIYQKHAPHVGLISPTLSISLKGIEVQQIQWCRLLHEVFLH